MSTYNIAHGLQRVELKRLAELMALPTTKRGAKRTTPVPATQLRISIVERALGRDIGRVGKHANNAAEVDAWLADSVVGCYLGKLGILHKQAQSALCDANNAKAELKELYAKRAEAKRRGSSGPQILKQIVAMQQEVRRLYAIAAGYLDAIDADNALRAAGVDLTDIHEQDRKAAIARRQAEQDRRRAAQAEFFSTK